MVAKGFLGKLLANDAVSAYVSRHAAEILEQFELVLSTVSMEEAVQQAEAQGGGTNGDNTTHMSQPAEFDSRSAEGE